MVIAAGSQTLVITAALLWYAFQEFLLGNFDAFLSTQLAMSIANPLVRLLLVITRLRAWVWVIAGLPIGGHVGQSAFALQGLFFMILVDLILGPLTTLAVLLKVIPRLFPRLRLPLVRNKCVVRKK